MTVPPVKDDSDAFLASVIRIGLTLALAGTVALALFAELRHAISFALGAVLAFLNFRLLEQGVGRALVGDPRDGSFAVVWRFGLRFVLYGAGLYAIIAARYLDLLTAAVGLSLFVLAIIFKGFYDTARDLLAGNGSSSGGP